MAMDKHTIDPHITANDELEKIALEQDMHDFQKEKLEQEAKKNWDLFYKRNSTNFFKDRRWLTKEFPEITELDKTGGTICEIGCGVGNTILPLIEECSNIFFHGCDLSPRAINFLKEDDRYNSERMNCFEFDITANDLISVITPNTVDLVTLVFVLSAITPEKMVLSLKNIHKVMKPGGIVLFRDYGLYDHAMLRFKAGHKIQSQFYKRQDGTRAFYFSTEDTENIFSESGFELLYNRYESRETVNRKEKVSVQRVFIQSSFVKPLKS